MSISSEQSFKALVETSDGTTKITPLPDDEGTPETKAECKQKLKALKKSIQDTKAQKKKLDLEAENSEKKKLKKADWAPCNQMEVRLEGTEETRTVDIFLEDPWLAIKAHACTMFEVNENEYEMFYTQKAPEYYKKRGKEAKAIFGRIDIWDGYFVLAKKVVYEPR